MNRKPLPTDESWENDAVWRLLDQAPPASADPRFVDNAVRAARLMDQSEPWWKRVFKPAPMAALAGATAALVFSIISLGDPTPLPGTPSLAMDTERAAEIQEIAETETLIAAVDHLDDFSDTELVSLIGF
jgi:anti-sigma factor RsiW